MQKSWGDNSYCLCFWFSLMQTEMGTKINRIEPEIACWWLCSFKPPPGIDILSYWLNPLKQRECLSPHLMSTLLYTLSSTSFHIPVGFSVPATSRLLICTHPRCAAIQIYHLEKIKSHKDVAHHGWYNFITLARNESVYVGPPIMLPFTAY